MPMARGARNLRFPKPVDLVDQERSNAFKDKGEPCCCVSKRLNRLVAWRASDSGHKTGARVG